MSFKKLRYVKDHEDVFEAYDHNDHVDNWKAQSNINDELKYEDPELEDLLNKLKSIIAKMKYIKSLEFYTAEYHNLFVDAWLVQEEINDKLKYYKDRASELEQLLAIAPRIYARIGYRVSEVVTPTVSAKIGYKVSEMVTPTVSAKITVVS